VSRWLRIIRGMVGMGLTFSAGVGAIASLVAGALWLITGAPFRELAFPVVASSIWAFPIGVAFSGVIALTARGRTFERLSVPRFAALGAAAGLALFGVLALNAWDAWSLPTAIANATLFVLLGGGSATASLLIARRAGGVLEAGDEPLGLDAD